MEEKKKKKVIGFTAGWILFTLLGLFLYGIVGGIIGLILDGINGTTLFQYLVPTAVSAIYVLIYQRANRETFDGCYKSDILKKGLIMCLPWALSGFVDTLANVLINHHSLGINPAFVFLMPITAAVCEENTYRTVPVAHMMRCVKSEDKIVTVCLLTSLVFSLSHLMNLASDDFAHTAVQICHSFGAGMLGAAIYLRTGSIIPSMAGHYFNNLFCAFDVGSYVDGHHAAGALNLVTTTLDLLFGIGAAIFALYLLRPSKRAEILERWKKKWGN